MLLLLPFLFDKETLNKANGKQFTFEELDKFLSKFFFSKLEKYCVKENIEWKPSKRLYKKTTMLL